MQLSSGRSNTFPLAKRYPSTVVAVTISTFDGLWSSPPVDPARRKNRFGHVGPGMDENHWSQMANSCAS